MSCAILRPAGRTRVNGTVAVGDTQRLSDGDRIELGQTLLVFPDSGSE